MRWSVLTLLAALLLVVLVWLVSRWMPMPKPQQQALALLHAEPAALVGSNAFDGIWLLGFEGVPDTERAAIVAEDVLRMQALAGRMGDVSVTGAEAASVAQARYRQVADTRLPCHWRQADCLAQVRADPAAVEAALAGQGGLLARINALAADEHYRNRFQPDGRLPLPSFTLLQRSLSAHALAHVQGRSDAALMGICNDTRTAKMLMSQSDGLVPANIGAAMVGGNVRLLASVLAELPLDQPLPSACEGVFVAPAPQTMSLCSAMRGEFAMVSAGFKASPERLAWLVLDPQKTQGLLALSMAGACTPGAMAALAADTPAQWARVPQASRWRLECAANAMGCVIADISGPAYDNYGLSLQDAGARLRLAEGLLWLRANPQVDMKSALAQMPARLREGERPLQLGSDGASLQVASYYAKDNGAAFAVPLPDTAVVH